MTVRVKVLRCDACGAPVPLGDGDHVKCPWCGADVAIPEEQRALRDAVRADAATRTSAAALYAEVGAPPSILLRVFTFVTPLALTIVGVPVLLIGSILIYQTAGSALGRVLFHVEVLDVYSENTHFIASTALGFALALLLLVLGAYGHRRGVSLREVQAGLAMRPPGREGGPATCRVCGAPLTLPTDAEGVMCDYCRADNLVRVPEGWLRAARTGTQKLAAAIEDATAAYRADAEALRKRLRARLAGWAALAVVCVWTFAWGFSLDRPLDALNDWPPSWKADVRGPRTMHAHRASVRGIQEPIHPDHGVPERCDGPWLDDNMGAWSTKAACDASGCAFRWIVALRHGERLTAHTNAIEGPLHFYQHIPSYPLDDDDFKPLRTVTLAPAVTLEAPVSAWYAVGLRIKGMAPGHGLSLCFTITPGR